VVPIFGSRSTASLVWRVLPVALVSYHSAMAAPRGPGAFGSRFRSSPLFFDSPVSSALEVSLDVFGLGTRALRSLVVSIPNVADLSSGSGCFAHGFPFDLGL
jgi:hypothetical protein